ncbi:MAG: tRNA pseudouridine(38-40) synthase TruA [Pseudomonadota bacterium]
MRLALGVEYLGTRYMGWQRQHHGPSVQAELERALSRIANADTAVVCAGRTDTGVHAVGQVVHFDCTATRHPHNWLAGANSALPDDIAVRWVQEVSPSFHARFDAESRRYVYLIRKQSRRSVLSHNRAFSVPQTLDVGAMHAASQAFIGEHDFSTFRAAGCQSRSPVRCVTTARVRCAGDWVWFDVTANAFVQHMVRNMVGALVQVGRGELPTCAIASLLERRDRTAAPFAAPPSGLYLWHVSYPAAHDLTTSPPVLADTFAPLRLG